MSLDAGSPRDDAAQDRSVFTSLGLDERAALCVDVERAARDYAAQNEFVFVESAFAAPLVRALAAEATSLRARAHRSVVPGYRKGGSVGYHSLRAHAPVAMALYASPALRALVERLAGCSVVRCPDDDPHAAALYYYTEAGDRVGFHYDTSHYRGARYTVLVGLIDRSSARLVCELHRGDRTRPSETLRLATPPGSLAIFHGDKLYHAVSPVADGEERVVLSMEFVTDPTMSPARKALSDLKDALTYFGFRGVFGRRR